MAFNRVDFAGTRGRLANYTLAASASLPPQSDAARPGQTFDRAFSLPAARLNDWPIAASWVARARRMNPSRVESVEPLKGA